MKNPKFTSGPWFADANFVRHVDSGLLISELYISPNNNCSLNGNLTANARLIAAAPDMYDAIDLSISLLSGVRGISQQDRIRLDDALSILDKSINKIKTDK